ncbi:ndufs1 NADH-ubiquinone oxidoreductase subunit, partial [Tieghemiomyces parasiticus]
DLPSLRGRMFEISPTLVRFDAAEPTSAGLRMLGLEQLLRAAEGARPASAPIPRAVQDFYLTDPISRASSTMAKCSATFTKGQDPPAEHAGEAQVHA